MPLLKTAQFKFQLRLSLKIIGNGLTHLIQYISTTIFRKLLKIPHKYPENIPDGKFLKCQKRIELAYFSH